MFKQTIESIGKVGGSAAIALGLFGMPASAATLTTYACFTSQSQTCASAVEGLEVAGTTYNVSIAQNSFDNLDASSAIFFGDAAGASAFVDALNSEFAAADVFGVGDGVTLVGGDLQFNSSFFLPYETAGTNVLSILGQRDTIFPPFDPPFNWSNFGTFNVNFSSGTTFAIVSVAPVPLPAALPLLAGGLGLLGLLGWRRKRTIAV